MQEETVCKQYFPKGKLEFQRFLYVPGQAMWFFFWALHHNYPSPIYRLTSFTGRHVIHVTISTKGRESPFLTQQGDSMNLSLTFKLYFPFYEDYCSLTVLLTLMPSIKLLQNIFILFIFLIMVFIVDTVRFKYYIDLIPTREEKAEFVPVYAFYDRRPNVRLID